MAFVGDTPWHGLGQTLTSGADIETWRVEAGLNFDVLSSPVQYESDGLRTMSGRNVLYRSDNRAALSVVSDRYNVVQPSQVLDFFKELVDTAGFELETAGVLRGGAKVWALAKVNEGADVIGHDTVRPYILLATSFDATLATTAKFTAVRVVCNNTLTMAAGGNALVAQAGQTEQDTQTAGPVVQSVKVLHSERFDAQTVRQQLGIVVNSFDRFMVNSRLLAHKDISLEHAQELTYKLIEPLATIPKGKTEKDVRGTRNYKRILELFDGGARGFDLAGYSAWGWLNSVTELVDHERGANTSTRLDSAWFGTGDNLKTRALELALAA
jgi:phage/plasmid-like protein (TIGR03299 family)